MNPKKPHKAVIRVIVEVHELLDTGECSGQPVEAEELAKFELKTKDIIEVQGFDRTDCLKKTKERLYG